MKKVEDIGGKAHNAEVTEAILWFVTAFLLLIPGLGEIAEEADVVAVATTLRLLGDAEDVGLTTYDIVTTKDRGPGVIFEGILGGLGALDMLKAPELFGKAASARRAMSDSDIATLGDEVSGGLAQVKLVKQDCF
ncbi:hypothetical protein N7468_007745 [Penicillium chermesinum]|uniref:Uncharacterized protein n=1 Tax=Penicillium chermesinum TaxID=63820 RepID=A0A9W9TMF9_9EURO|nr:uncharacterized protein N7468_007745 [Penicillium chermesinum]KAJ5226520.1 hypothetical protein N7468_007745 [Penicillium chermesinum]KAJ6160302.1 hypothetical protein N7470_003698 [Penicillium chermesinum]